MNAMRRIGLQQIQPGMVLAADARTVNGKTVLGRGTALTSDHIKTLKAWGIPEIQIQDGRPAQPGNDEFSQTDPEKLAQAEQRVRLLFIKSNPQHPAIQELMQLTLKSFLKN